MFNQQKKYISIEILCNDEEYKFLVISAVLKKGKLTQISHEQFHNWEELKAYCSSTPIFLTVSTNQILIKLQNIGNDDSSTPDISLILPNINPDDFYIQYSQILQTPYIALARKEYLNEIIEIFEKYNITIKGISLGFLSSLNVLSEISLNFVTTEQYLFEINRTTGKISYALNINKEQGKLIIYEGEKFPEKFLIALSSLIFFLEKKFKSNESLKELNENLSKKEFQSTYFLNVLKYGLSILLFISLINASIYFYYFREIDYYKSAHPFDLHIDKRIGAVKMETEENKKKIQLLSKYRDSKKSIYLNRVLTYLPESILLETIKISPIKNHIQEGEEIEYEERNIRIKGEAKNEEAISFWIDRLNDDSLIVDASITKLLWNREKKKSEFEITVLTHPF